MLSLPFVKIPWQLAQFNLYSVFPLSRRSIYIARVSADIGSGRLYSIFFWPHRIKKTAQIEMTDIVKKNFMISIDPPLSGYLKPYRWKMAMQRAAPRK